MYTSQKHIYLTILVNTIYCYNPKAIVNGSVIISNNIEWNFNGSLCFKMCNNLKLNIGIFLKNPS